MPTENFVWPQFTSQRKVRFITRAPTRNSAFLETLNGMIKEIDAQCIEAKNIYQSHLFSGAFETINVRPTSSEKFRRAIEILHAALQEKAGKHHYTDIESIYCCCLYLSNSMIEVFRTVNFNVSEKPSISKLVPVLHEDYIDALKSIDTIERVDMTISLLNLIVSTLNETIVTIESENSNSPINTARKIRYILIKILVERLLQILFFELPEFVDGEEDRDEDDEEDELLINHIDSTENVLAATPAPVNTSPTNIIHVIY